MKKYLLLYFLFALSATVSAQKSFVHFHVCDAVNWEPIEKVTLELFRDDTLRVDFRKVREERGSYGLEFDYREGNYLLKGKAEGYEPFSKRFEMHSRRNSTFDAGNFALKKEKTHTLGEATVRATHIKMVMKGDTVVYDAAAFDLATGSMLDELIQALPNVELKDGQIKVNGKFVSSLLVNGEDFFQGNPKVALQNLPAYTVKNIKVYDKLEDDAYLKGGKRRHGLEKENLVMDVSLKKAYSTGWMGNMQGGYGLPGNPYLGKAFFVGYTDKLRLSVFGNVNNVIDTQAGGAGDDWSGGWYQDGRLDLRMGGTDYSYKKDKLKIWGNAVLTHEDIDLRRRTAAVSFYDTGDLYGRSATNNDRRRVHFVTSHSLQYSGDNYYLKFSPYLDYRRDRDHNLNLDATLSENPNEDYRGEALDSLFRPDGAPTVYTQYLLHRVRNASEGVNEHFQTGGSVDGTVQLTKLGSDYFTFNASGKYSHDQRNPFSAYQRVFGPKSGTDGKTEHIDQQTDFDSKSRSASANLLYNWEYKPYHSGRVHEVMIRPVLDYSFYQGTEDNLLYQFKEGELTPDALAQWLPSVLNERQLTLDVNNTYGSERTTHYFTPMVNFRYVYKPSVSDPRELSVNVALSDQMEQERLDYDKQALDTVLNRFSHRFHPSVTLYYRHDGKKAHTGSSLSYRYAEALPSIDYQLGQTRDDDPSNVYLSNPNLHRMRSHNLSLTYFRFHNEAHRSFYASAYYSRRDQSIAQTRTFNRETGVNTWMPRNVDGNWNVSADLTYVQPFGKREAFSFHAYTSVSYSQSVDYSSETDSPQRSVVKNLNLPLVLALDYKLGKHNFNVRSSAYWRNSRSERASFADIHAVDLDTWFTVKLNFKKDWQIHTNLNMDCRRGYDDATLNTTQWVWNASLSKRFMDGRLAFTLSAVDLLKQVRNVTYDVNAQGRTEMWTNSLPRYVMLRMAYRFNVKPKKSKN